MSVIVNETIVLVETTEIVISALVNEEIVLVDSIENSSSVVVNEASTLVDTIQASFSVVTTDAVTTVVYTDSQGPPGPTGISEEDIMYAKRIDFTTDSTLYKAEAVVGSLESAAAWRIRYIVIAADNDVTETWASGTAEKGQHQ